MAGIWILAEDYNHTLELLTVGCELAHKTGNKISVLCPFNKNTGDDLISRGADEVILFPSLSENENLAAYVPVIVDEALAIQPDIFLLGASLQVKEMAARIAASLNTGLCSECIALNLIDGTQSLEMERLIFGGAAVQKVTCLTSPQMATIPPRTFAPAEVQAGRLGKTRELPAPPPSKIKVLAKKPRVRETENLTEARIIVCVGRGMEKEEDLALARDLAEVLGAELGCTRPISDELHWMPEETCIGLSGIQVKPDLYIGLGVSGQIQHITGIRDARVICALNNDENAPIFEVSDYGVQGDLYQLVPQLIKEIKKALGK